MIRPLLFDSSVIIPLINEGRHEQLFQRAIRSGRALLCSVVMQELYAGTPDTSGKWMLDEINRALLRAGAMVTPQHEDWCDAGVLLARYGRLYGKIEPRDHLADLLIACCAGRASAILVTENEKDMQRWATLLECARRPVEVKRPGEI